MSLTPSDFEIDDIDKSILKFMVDHPSMTIKAIAEQLSVSVNTVSRRMKKPGFIKARKDILATTEDLMVRAQKLAARRLLSLINHHEPKIALEAMKLALGPLNNRKQIETKSEVIFQTRIGSQGQLMQEVVEVSENKDKPKAQPEIIEGKECTEGENNES